MHDLPGLSQFVHGRVDKDHNSPPSLRRWLVDGHSDSGSSLGAPRSDPRWSIDIAAIDCVKFEENVSSKSAGLLAVVVDYGDSRWLSTRSEDLGSFRAARLEILEAWCKGLSHGSA